MAYIKIQRSTKQTRNGLVPILSLFRAWIFAMRPIFHRWNSTLVKRPLRRVMVDGSIPGDGSFFLFYRYFLWTIGSNKLLEGWRISYRRLVDQTTSSQYESRGFDSPEAVAVNIVDTQIPNHPSEQNQELTYHMEYWCYVVADSHQYILGHRFVHISVYMWIYVNICKCLCE